MATVTLDKVSKSFGPFLAVDCADIVIANGSFFSLLGPSGSGKTTLLRLIAGFLVPDKGDIFISDRRVTQVPPYKRNIGMVFQNYALFPHKTVLENVAFSLKMRGVEQAEVLKRSREALAMVRMEKRESAYPKELSGGQQQRVAVARSISSRPAVWLLDEPLSALDRQLRVEMQAELRTLQRQLGVTAVYVTHDQEEALAMSDRIAIFRDGRIAQQGTAQELYERPTSAFVAEFLGSANLLNATLRKSAQAWAVEIEGVTIPIGTAPAASDGSPVRIAVRPERTRVHIESRSDHAIKAVVRSIVYLGSDLRVTLSMPSGAAIAARLASSGAEGLAALHEGREVFVSWRPEEAMLV